MYLERSLIQYCRRFTASSGKADVDMTFSSEKSASSHVAVRGR
jgi:hypothetical protein